MSVFYFSVFCVYLSPLYIFSLSLSLILCILLVETKKIEKKQCSIEEKIIKVLEKRENEDKLQQKLYPLPLHEQVNTYFTW